MTIKFQTQETHGDTHGALIAQLSEVDDEEQADASSIVTAVGSLIDLVGDASTDEALQVSVTADENGIDIKIGRVAGEVATEVPFNDQGLEDGTPRIITGDGTAPEPTTPEAMENAMIGAEYENPADAARANTPGAPPPENEPTTPAQPAPVEEPPVATAEEPAPESPVSEPAPADAPAPEAPAEPPADAPAPDAPPADAPA
jgi:hypothetical protein